MQAAMPIEIPEELRLRSSLDEARLGKPRMFRLDQVRHGDLVPTPRVRVRRQNYQGSVSLVRSYFLRPKLNQ